MIESTRARVVWCCVVMMIAAVSLAGAQGAAGTITGVASDQSGAVLPGVSIAIRNADTGATRELVTDTAGRFQAPNLPPGPYTVSATLAGFGKVERSGIRLTVGRDAVVDFQLKVGAVQDVITVVGEVSAIETRSASTGGLISEEQISNLPLNGRSFIELATTTPGVQLTPTGGRSTSTGFGQKISVHGARYTQNLFTLDGTMMNDQFNQSGSATGNMLGVEAVREFQVLTNTFSAEYGRHTGAVVNAATKTGTNAFRGSVFEFHRNEALDANRWEAERNNLDKPDFLRNQFGISAGGPLVRGKTFFFGNYEGLRENLGVTRTFRVPNEAVRAAAGPVARAYLDAYPLPNGRVLDAQRSEFVRQDTRQTEEHYAVGRIDHEFTPNHRIFARYTWNKGEVTDPERVNTGAITRTKLGFGTFEYQTVRGAGLVNRMQVGYTSSKLDGYDYVLEGINLPRTTFTEIDRGIGLITISQLDNWGGSSTNPKFHNFSNIQLSDSLALIRGAHNLKFGGHMEYQRYNLTSDFTSMGQYAFASLNTFLAGTPRTFDAVRPGSDTSRRLRQYVFGVFVQDDWQIRRDLTLNLGVRYEPTSDITEADGKLAQLIDFASPTATINDTTIVDAVIKNPTKKNFAPRAGVAWNIGGKGKTSVRAGAGLFYDLVTANTNFVQNTAVRVPPFFDRPRISNTAANPLVFPDAYFVQAHLMANTGQLEGIQYDADQPRMVKWNVNVQHEVLPRTSVEVGYTGTRGYNLFRQIYTNGPEAITTADGRLFVPEGTPQRQPNFGRMRLRVSDARSWYNGLTVGLTRRDATLQTQVSYTLGKSEDEGASAIGGNDFDNEAGGSRYLFLKEKGLSPFDIRHSLVTSVNWDMPFGRTGDGLTSALIRNWSVGTLIRVRSGIPFSVQTGGLLRARQPDAPDYPDLCPGADPNPVLGGPDQYFDPTAFCLQPAGFVGNAPRNSVIGPGYASVDLMVGRGLKLSENRTVQLRFEVFNLLNRANFALPNAGLFNADGTYSADAGRITSTVGTPRQMQLGVKFVW